MVPMSSSCTVVVVVEIFKLGFRKLVINQPFVTLSLLLFALKRSQGSKVALDMSASLHHYPTYNACSRLLSLCQFNKYCRFHVTVRLFSNISQMTPKCGKNKQVAHQAIACVPDVLTTFWCLLWSIGVSNGLCEHLRACEQCVYFCEHEQWSNMFCEQRAL